MVRAAAIVASVVLTSSPRAVSLTPTSLAWMPNLFVQSASQGSTQATPPEKSFKTGWFIAGLAGGFVTAALAAPRTWSGCPHDPNSPPKHGAAIAVAAISIGLGTTLGYLEGKDIADTRGLIIAFDILGPTAAGLSLLAKCP